MEWCLFALPFCSLVILLLWLFLQCCYREGLPDAEDPGFREGVLRCMASTEVEQTPRPSVAPSSPRKGRRPLASPVRKPISPPASPTNRADSLECGESDGGARSPTYEGAIVAYGGKTSNGDIDIEFGGGSSEDGGGGEGGGESGDESEESALYWTRVFVVLVVVATAVMLSLESLQTSLGHIGIVALFPTIVFFGGGFLSQNDFETLPWSVLMLMGGGLALGVAVRSSGLLTILAAVVTTAMEGQPLFVVLLTINISVGIFGNFISSTVAAIIMMHLIAQLGQHYNHVKMMVVGAAVMCSGSMGLPVSSFPNANSITAKVTSHIAD
jgi:hypothetical protein